MRFLGVDLAWGEGTEFKPANRSGVVALDERGRVLDADWTSGLPKTIEWMNRWGDEPSLAFVDAPLIVTNDRGQRACEREVGRRFGRHLVSANTTNLASRHQAGVRLCERLADDGWHYDDGLDGPPADGRTISECYPYTTLVGAAEFAFSPRPRYKRKPKAYTTKAKFWPQRLRAWDDIVRRLAALADGDPPLDIDSHEATRALRDTPGIGGAQAYKKAEDLLDAAICAWTAALWHRHEAKCAVLGAPGAGAAVPIRPVATIIVPISAETDPLAPSSRRPQRA